jgi:hypothetical protein
MINIFTRIYNTKDLLDGDCVRIDYMWKKQTGKSKDYELSTNYTDHAIYENGEFISVIDNKPLKPRYGHEKIHIYLHNYLFVSKKDEWYDEGTVAYPDIDNYGSNNQKDWKENGAALFQGIREKHWDGETCSFDEFEITERVNQTRARKLLRLLK